MFLKSLINPVVSSLPKCISMSRIGWGRFFFFRYFNPSNMNGCSNAYLTRSYSGNFRIFLTFLWSIAKRRGKNVFRFLLSLRKKCPYSEFFWSVFSRIRTEYGDLLCKFPYSVLMRENADQKNSEYGHFTQ